MSADKVTYLALSLPVLLMGITSMAEVNLDRGLTARE